MDLNVFGKQSEAENVMKDTVDAIAKESEKLEAVLRNNGLGDKVDAIKSAVESASSKVKQEVKQESKKISERLRDEMLRLMEDRNESEIGLSDDYWKAKNAFHQALAEGK